MHAALIHLTIDPAQGPAAAAAFTQNILPKVKGAAGLVAGYWLDPADGHGFGFLVFENEEQAVSATPPATKWSAPGVIIEHVHVRRVAVAVP